MKVIPSELLQISHYTEAAPLLAFLAKKFERWPQQDFAELVSALTLLLKVRHYAGAREVIEAIFDRTFAAWNLDTAPLNTLFRSIFAQDFSDSMSVAAMETVLGYMLDRLQAKHPPKVIDLQTLRLLLLHPEYISIPALSKLRTMLAYPHLRPFLGQQDGFGQFTDGIPVCEDHLWIMHSIMQVYGMHGLHEQAQLWMQMISKASALKTEAKIESPPPSAYVGIRQPLAKRRKTSFAQKVATTYLASFGRKPGRFASAIMLSQTEPPLAAGLSSPGDAEKEGVERLTTADALDSDKAMAFFDHVRTAGAKEASSEIERLLGSPDIVAWTALLAVVSRDRNRVSADALCDAFDRLRNDRKSFRQCRPALTDCLAASLPDPNTATYTVVLSGLIARQQAVKAISVFEQDFMPKADSSNLQLDTLLLQEYMSALMADGQLVKASAAMQYFAKTQSEDDIVDDRIKSHPLQWSLQLDTHFLNRRMTELARHGLYEAAYQVYDKMESTHAVTPDEVSLSILAKAAISSGVRAGRGTAPSNSEDAFSLDSEASSPSGSQLGRWGGHRPADLIMHIYWRMLSQNFPLAKEGADAAVLSPARRLFFGAPNPAAPLSPKTHALRQADYHLESLPYPHLCPSPTNMHLFIAVLGYFSSSSKIPLALAYMKELSIRPTRKTLCLALWSYEEGGAMTSDRKRLIKWLVDWLGSKAIPTDVEIGRFRRRQWERA